MSSCCCALGWGNGGSGPAGGDSGGGWWFTHCLLEQQSKVQELLMSASGMREVWERRGDSTALQSDTESCFSFFPALPGVQTGSQVPLQYLLSP
jgi:hypothetical protein